NTVLFLGLQAYIVRALITPELAAAQDPHFSVKGLIGPLVISHRRRGGAAQRPCRLRDLPSHAAVLHHAAGAQNCALSRCGERPGVVAGFHAIGPGRWSCAGRWAGPPGAAGPGWPPGCFRRSGAGGGLPPVEAVRSLWPNP